MTSRRKRSTSSAVVRGPAQRVTAQGPVASAAASASAAPSVDVAATAEEMDLQLASHFLDLARMKLQAAGPNDPLANAEYVKAQAEVAQAEAKADVEWSRALGPTEHDLLLPRERAFLHTMRKVELAKAKVSLAEAKVAQTEALQGSVRSSMDWNGRVEKFQRTVAALEDQISEAMSNLTLNAVARAPVDAIVPFAHNPVAQAFVDALMSAEATNIGPPSGM